MSKRSDLFASQLRIVDGWIELGDYHEANEALEDIKPPLRATMEALERREKICAAMGETGVRRRFYPPKR